MMRFADPFFFLLLLVLIPVVWYGRTSGGRIRFSSLDLFQGLKGEALVNPRNILLLLRILSLILLLAALARPQAGKRFSEIRSDGIDIILALDTSGSMQALDFTLNNERVDRLEVVKKVVNDFIHKRPADRMGLVVFGTDAFTQCPLTLDHGILVEFLKKIEIGMAGEATAIGSAIGTGVKRLKDLKAKSKVLILLTDGRSNAGRIEPLKAAELAKTFAIKVYTIGVGTRGQAPFLQDGFFGKHYIYQQVDIDEDTLREVANITGGKYYRATETTELEKIYAEIDQLEKTEVKVKEYTQYNELFHWFLIVGLILLLLEIFLGHTWLRKIP